MPGKSKRVGLDVFELFDRFPDESTSEAWFENVFWVNGRVCGHCGSSRTKERKSRKPMPYHCSDCRKYFSVKTGTVMHASNIPLQKWAIAMYQLTTSLEGTSSMKLHRDLKISYSCTWHLSHRIREGWDQYCTEKLGGENEVDKSYFGGKEGKKHASKKLQAGRGSVVKTAVVGIKNRVSKQVRAQVVENTNKKTLQGSSRII